MNTNSKNLNLAVWYIVLTLLLILCGKMVSEDLLSQSLGEIVDRRVGIKLFFPIMLCVFCLIQYCCGRVLKSELSRLQKSFLITLLNIVMLGLLIAIFMEGSIRIQSCS